jgi:hypothetical protein
MTLRPTALALAMALGTAAPALAADTLYSGRTSQHRPASMRVKADGTIALMRVRQLVKPCRERGVSFGPITVRYRDAPGDPVERHGSRFGDGPTWSTYRRPGRRNHLRFTMRGRFRAGGRVTGFQDVLLRNYQHGKLHEVCHGRVRFTLRPTG